MFFLLLNKSLYTKLDKDYILNLQGYLTVIILSVIIYRLRFNTNDFKNSVMSC